MGSPFPGVDPFLEGQGIWSDFHFSFICCWREMLMRTLPKGYVARIEQPPLRTSPGRLDHWIPMRRIEIQRRSDDGVVTILELLAPMNKNEPGRGEYLSERGTWRGQQVNLVEVDLLLNGVRVPFARPLVGGDFYAAVSRRSVPGRQEVWFWRLQDRLPVIRIPLEGSDEDIVSDLQEAYTTTFDRAAFEQLVRYDQPIGIALTTAMQAWMDERLRIRGY